MEVSEVTPSGGGETHLFVCHEVCLLEQLLFVMLEFSDHLIEFRMKGFVEEN